ncbi:MAG: nucleotidyltransferase family protein [Planctomycetota bacterium]|nr:nucleotidyltransferase family protein [Planctomycetota bacterium]
MTHSPSSRTGVLERMVNAVEQVRQRLLRVSRALRAGGVPHAVVGGHAVAAWVATVDGGAARTTQDVDVLIRRADLERCRAVLEGAGFVYRHAAGMDLFLDSPQSSPRQGVHLVFANEFVRAGEAAANPDVEDASDMGELRVLNLHALVRIKLTAYRDKDRTHLRDLIGVGLIDRAWADRLPEPLAERLRALLDTPDG